MNITTHSYRAASPVGPIFSFFPGTIPVRTLQVHIKTEHQHCTALVDLGKLGEELNRRGSSKLLEILLSEEEQAYFARFSYPKRRHEWLGGRIAAKTAILQYIGSDRLEEDFQRLTILPDEHGRPTAGQIPEITVSISHSSGFAVAMATREASCGIDLQKISAKLGKVTDRFASEEELTILAGLPAHTDQLTGMTMLWTVKEALKKSMLHDQPAIFSGIKLQQIELARDYEYDFYCTIKERREQRARVYAFSSYILALTGTAPYA